MSKLRKYINKQEGGDEQEFLKNWYSKRKIKDKYIQEAYELDKPNIMKNLNNFKDFTYVDSIKGGNSKEMQGLVKGQFQIPNKVLIKKGLTKEDLNETKLHELNHYSTYDKSGDYMTTIHQNIVDSELLPKEYRNKEYQNDYYSDPREVHSRIMVLRKDAGFKPDKPVTMKDLDGYLKKKEVRDKKGNLLHYKLPSNVNDIFNNAKDHDAILNMLNYMAVNEPTDNGVIKAQTGNKGLVNAEAGEVYKDKQGNIMKVSDEAPSHDDGVLVDENENLHNASYNNGGVVIDANSVLSATHENRDSSDKSYGLVDELIKIKPKELKQYGDMLGLKVKSKKIVSPSKAFELLRDSKIKQVNKLLNVEDDVFADSFKRNSIKANLQQANSLISDEELYDTLFQIQEQKKLI